MKQQNIKFLLALLVCMLDVKAFAHDIAVANDDGVTIYYVFTKNGTELAVSYRGSSDTSYSNEYTGKVVIPEYVTYKGTTYSVTSIGPDAFWCCSGLTGITIPNSVTSIGANAFGSCRGLTSIDIPNSVTSIEASAFRGCSGLTNITIPNSVASIGYAAFWSCSGLTSVDILNSVTSIGVSAFQNCISLTSLTIPNSVTSIGTSAFANCSGLASIIVESGNSYYDSRDNCNAIIETATNTLVAGCKNTIIFNSVTSIGANAFSGCSRLTSIDIPNSVTSIGSSAFSGCSRLTSITIPNSVTSIGSSAFANCSGLTDVKVKMSTPIDIEENVFTNPFNATLYVPKGSGDAYMEADYWKEFKEIVEGDYIAVVNDDGKTIYYSYINNDTELEVSYRGGKYDSYSNEYSGNVVIPESVTYNGKTYPVTSIGYSAFRSCSGLTSVTIPNSVTSIGHLAFASCSDLTSVTVGNSLTRIEEMAFYECTALTSFTIPNSVTSIGRSAFAGCSSLTSITIGNSLTRIEELAFYECTALTSFTIPNSVTSIGMSAFAGCSSLTSITIGNSVTSIEVWAFSRCSSLTSVTIPNSVNSIWSSALQGCSGLKSVTIGNSVTSIGDQFYGCSSLESVTIGSGVLSIERDAFKDHRPTKVTWLTNTPPSGYAYAAGTVNYVPNDQYTSLSNKTVYPFLSSMFEVDGIKYVPVSLSERTCDAIDCTYEPTIDDITIGGTVVYKGVQMNVKQIKPYTLYNNQHVNNVTIGNSGDVGDYAFSLCGSLQTATLDEGVTGIGQYAFRGCSKLGGLFIPNSVTSIGQYAFSNCSALTDMQIGSKVGTIGSYAFNNCSRLSTITIPQSVTKVSDYVFSGCTSLKNVYIADRNTILTLGSNGSSSLFSSCPLDYVYIGGNITYNTGSGYGYSPFYGNTTLREVVITDKETEISANEFRGCTNLQSFTVGDGLTSFGDRAFSGCSNLKSLSFGPQLQSIGQEAFSDCTSITEITSLAATPPACGLNALDDINKWECTLHVPEGYKAAYLAADQWKDFLFMNEDSGSGETPHVDPNALVISEAGFATYCPTVDVDFTTLPEVKAYIASGFNRKTGALTMTRVYDVPAGTGLVVKGPAGIHEVPQSPSASIYSNLLRGSTIDRNLSATAGGYVNYVLGKIGDEVGFCPVPAEGMTLAAGRAYLVIPGETAASRSALKLRFDDEEEATGINASLTDSEERKVNSAVYDLQGRRVEQPRSGLYIRGGKKVIIK